MQYFIFKSYGFHRGFDNLNKFLLGTVGSEFGADSENLGSAETFGSDRIQIRNTGFTQNLLNVPRQAANHPSNNPTYR
jgi:hypothetical protein